MFTKILFSADAVAIRQHTHSTIIAISFLTIPFMALFIAICWLAIDWPGLLKHIIKGRHVKKRETHSNTKIVFNTYSA